MNFFHWNEQQTSPWSSRSSGSSRQVFRYARALGWLVVLLSVVCAGSVTAQAARTTRSSKAVVVPGALRAKPPAPGKQRLAAVRKELKKEEKEATRLLHVGKVVSIVGFSLAGLSLLSFVVGSATDDLSLNLRLNTTALYVGVPLSLVVVGAGLPMWGLGHDRRKRSLRTLQLLKSLQLSGGPRARKTATLALVPTQRLPK